MLKKLIPICYSQKLKKVKPDDCYVLNAVVTGDLMVARALLQIYFVIHNHLEIIYYTCIILNYSNWGKFMERIFNKLIINNITNH